jgi:hypothetical protein
MTDAPSLTGLACREAFYRVGPLAQLMTKQELAFAVSVSLILIEQLVEEELVPVHRLLNGDVYLRMSEVWPILHYIQVHGGIRSI